MPPTAMSPHLDTRFFETLEHYLTGLMQERGVPGFALALTDKEKTLAVKTYGYANLESKTPLRPDHLFQIGSVSKSSVALLVLQEVEKGTLELHVPVTKYLPFFKTRDHHVITLHHLLTHSAGISRGLNAAPFTSYADVLHLQLAPSYEVGKSFYYSNLGYVTLGWVLEHVTGKTLPELRREHILEPLGMTTSTAQIGHAERSRFPTAYIEFYGDRPHHPSYGLTPAAFYEFIHGDGSMCATPEDLAKYARLFLNQGKYVSSDSSWQQLISEESFKLMTTSWFPADNGHFEGYGIECYSLNGSQCLEHNGETHGFTTELLVDMDEGLGLVLFTHCTGTLNLTQVAETILTLLQATKRSKSLPDLPDYDFTRVTNANEYAGTYQGKTTLEFQANGDELFLLWQGEKLRLEYYGDFDGQPRDEFCVTHQDFNRSAFVFLRDSSGSITELIHGQNWYYNEHHQGTTTFDVPAEWHTYIGEYHSFSPWSPAIRINIIKRELWLESYAPASFGTGPLTALPDGSFQLHEQLETISFDTLLGNRMMKAKMSGYLELYRSEMRRDGV